MADFTVDKLHLALLQRLNFTSYEQDIPSVDGKRPYGNKDVLDDILRLYIEGTSHEVVKIEDGGFLVLDGDRLVGRGGQDGEDDLEKKLLGYHSSMGTVLEILAQNLGIEEGVYERTGWPVQGRWTLKKPTERSHRRVALAIAESLTATDQDYVDAILDRVLEPTDELILSPDSNNLRALSYARQELIAVATETFDPDTLDLALVIFDPLMERGNSANYEPLELLILAQDEGIEIIEEESRPPRQD